MSAAADLAIAYAYCAALTRRQAGNFYYGFLLLPPDQRRAIYAAYAFARLCDDIVDLEGPGLEEKAALLADFRGKLNRCLEGRPEGPVFDALCHAVQSFRIPGHYFHQLIDGVEMDLRLRRYRNFQELRQYCYSVASVVGLICIEIFGYQDGALAREYAADLGIAFQLTNILRDIQEDLDRGRIYLPLEEMALFGCPEESLLRRETGEPFRRLVSFQVERARAFYRRGLLLLPLLPRRPRACVSVMTSIYRRILERIAREPEAVLRGRVGLSAGHKLALAGRELIRSVVLP